MKISVLSIFLFPVTLNCYAQANSIERDAMLFLETVAMQKKSVVCSARLPDFKSRFEPAFEKWRTSQSASLNNGEKFLRAAALAEKKDFDVHVGAVTDTAAKVLAESSQAMVEENCNAMLTLVR